MALLAWGPLAGTALCRCLRDLPLAGRGVSTGSVYPALGRLREAGLVETFDKPRRLDRAWHRYGPRPRGRVRRFQLNRLTAHGWMALRVWASRPLEAEDVRLRPEEPLLRFAALAALERERPPAGFGRPGAVEAFLGDYATVAASIALELRERLRYGTSRYPIRRRPPGSWGDPTASWLPREERLVFDLMARLFETRAAWARRASRELTVRAPERGGIR